MPKRTDQPSLTSNRQMQIGLKVSLSAGVLLMAAIGLMFFAVGAGGEEIAAPDDEAKVNRGALAVSMLMFGAANVIFWVGFLKMKRAMNRGPAGK